MDDKINKLTGFYQQIIGSEVCLRLESSATKQNKTCSVRLFIPGNDLLESAKGKKFEIATAQVIELLKRQINKHKTKITARRKNIIAIAKPHTNNPT